MTPQTTESAELPDALRLADLLLLSGALPGSVSECAGRELYRLHAENETLRAGYDAARLEIESLKAQLEAVGAGGVRRLAGQTQGVGHG